MWTLISKLSLENLPFRTCLQLLSCPLWLISISLPNWRKAEVLALSQYFLSQTSASISSQKNTSLVTGVLFWTYPVPPAIAWVTASHKSLSQCFHKGGWHYWWHHAVWQTGTLMASLTSRLPTVMFLFTQTNICSLRCFFLVWNGGQNTLLTWLCPLNCGQLHSSSLLLPTSLSGF